MRAPSLRTRVVVGGVTVVVIVLSVVNGLLYLAFRTQLLHNLDDVLDERARLVRTEAAGRSDRQLATRLTELGLQATIRGPDGTVYEAEPPSPRLGNTLPAPDAGSAPGTVSRDVTLPDGSVARVFARRSGVDDAARKLLWLEGAGLVGASGLVALLLLRTSSVALRPVLDMTAAARRTAAGRRGERLNPDRLDTGLGQLAAAYDDMLDSLEASETRANDAQAEAELLYVHLRQVIETANAGFVAMDSGGLITDWNSKAQDMFGWSRHEAVGRRLSATIIPPALRDAHTAGLHRFVETGEHRLLGTNAELEAVHRDGRTFPVEVATWVTYVGDEMTFNAFLRDVSERRKGEEAIGRLASIVESAQEAIFSTSLDGTILTWNSGAEQLYDYPAEEAVGHHVSMIVPADRTKEVDAVRERIALGQRVARHETVRRRKEGTEVHVAVTISPVFDAWGTVIGASTIARDITDQRRMADALADSRAALERALAEATRSDERSRQFLADAAHQLRSPITGLRASAEALLRGTAEDDRDALLAGLVREAARAGRLITSLLRLARIDQGRTIVRRPCDIVAVCESELHRTRLMAPVLDIDLTITDLPDPWPELDSESVSEILSNLLDNARRHAARSIEISIGTSGADLIICVTDDGPGIAPEATATVFERFVSLDGKGGSGLGLAIARELARAHGGDLTYGSGSFLLTLPAQVSPPQARPLAPTRSRPRRFQVGRQAQEAPLEVAQVILADQLVGPDLQRRDAQAGERRQQDDGAAGDRR